MPRRHLKRAREFNRDAQPFSCFDRSRYNITIVRNIKGAEELDTPPALENDVSPEGKFDEEDYDRTDATTQVPIGSPVSRHVDCSVLHPCWTARASNRHAKIGTS